MKTVIGVILMAPLIVFILVILFQLAYNELKKVDLFFAIGYMLVLCFVIGLVFLVWGL